jgi:hypothetical protein
VQPEGGEAEERTEQVGAADTVRDGLVRLRVRARSRVRVRARVRARARARVRVRRRPPS